MSDQKRVNGNLYSKASCTLKVAGEIFEGWDAVEFGDKRERAYAFGAGKHGGPRGKTKGRYTPDLLVVTFQTDSAAACRTSLAAKAPDGVSYGEASVLITLTIDEPGLGVQLLEFEDCTLAEDSASVEDSAEHVAEKLSFMPMRVRRNGNSLFDQTAAGA